MSRTVYFSKTVLLIRKNVIEKSRHLSKHTFLKDFWLGRILTDLKLSVITFLPFLCTGVTWANSKEEGKIED